jgi:PST family polysaccharide transporter
MFKLSPERAIPETSKATGPQTPPASRTGRIFKNIAWLCGDRLVRMGLGVSITLAVARFLGPQQFGSLNYLGAVVGLFGAFTALGLDQIVVRDLVRRPDAEAEITGTALGLRSFSSVLFLTICLALLYRLGLLARGNYIGLFFALRMPFDSFAVLEFVFQARVLSKYIVIARNAAFITIGAVRLWFLHLRLPLAFFGAAYLMESALGALLVLSCYSRYSGHGIRLRFNWMYAREILKESWPVILTGSAITVYMRIDILMLEKMAGPAAVGVYGAATRVSEIWYFVPMGIMSTLSPLITTYRANEELYYNRLQQCFSGMVGFSVAVSIVTSLGYAFIMRHLFGVGFAASGPILAVHVWSSIFVFLGVAQAAWMVTEQKLKISLLQTMLGAASNIVLNLFLIPKLQGMGAAIATVVSYAIAGVFANLLFRDTRRILRMQLNAFRLVGLTGFISMIYSRIGRTANA